MGMQALEKIKVNSRTVKFSNNIQNFQLGELTANEINLFMLIMHKMKGMQATDLLKKGVVINKADVTSLFSSRYARKRADFNKVSLGLFQKMLGIPYMVDAANGNRNGAVAFVIFAAVYVEFSELEENNFGDDPTEDIYAIFSPTKPFVDKFSEFDIGYTQLFLSEISNDFRSKYAKLIYNLLMQWNTLEVVQIPLKEFKWRLGISESTSPTDVRKRALSDAVIRELRKVFPDFTWGWKKQGKTIVSVELKRTRRNIGLEIKERMFLESPGQAARLNAKEIGEILSSLQKDGWSAPDFKGGQQVYLKQERREDIYKELRDMRIFSKSDVIEFIYKKGGGDVQYEPSGIYDQHKAIETLPDWPGYDR